MPEVAAVHATFEPVYALAIRAVGDGFWYHLPLRLPLQAIIADRRGGRQRLLNVAGFEERLHVVGAMISDAGETACLPFGSH